MSLTAFGPVCRLHDHEGLHQQRFVIGARLATFERFDEEFVGRAVTSGDLMKSRSQTRPISGEVVRQSFCNARP